MREKKDLSEEDYITIERLAKAGFSVASIAGNLGMSKATLDRRVSEDFKARQALERGRSISIEAVANTAFDMATSGKHPSMTMFWLKSRAGWSDKAEATESSQSIIIVDSEDMLL